MKNPVFLIVGVIAVAGLGALYLLNNNEETVVTNPLPAEQTEQTVIPTTFTWRFEEATTNNPDGNPQTDVYLTINHDGRSIERHVDTVDGDCNISEGEQYEDDISNAGSVQCYSAGLGQQYRVTQGQYIFLVERKLFEEALPDITPPVYEWEVMAEFSFT